MIVDNRLISGNLWQLKNELDRGTRFKLGDTIIYKTENGYHLEGDRGPTGGYSWEETLEHAAFIEDEWVVCDPERYNFYMTPKGYIPEEEYRREDFEDQYVERITVYKKEDAPIWQASYDRMIELVGEVNQLNDTQRNLEALIEKENAIRSTLTADW